jgi:hypothetical protein
MSILQIILLVVLIALIIGVLPAWPYSAGFGYWPSGLGVVLLVVVLIVIFGRRSDL